MEGPSQRWGRRGADQEPGAEAGTGGRERLRRLSQRLRPGSGPPRWAEPKADPEAGSP